MKYLFYDIGLLVLFALFVFIFLYRKRANLKKEGLLFLYRTKWGMKFIDYVGKKYTKTLNIVSYISITFGYFLMIGMLYLFGKIVYLYIAYPAIVREVKVPPIMPLVPYLPQAFKLSFLPPFFFIYWIVILAIIAIAHEFAHGIFMRKYNIQIKSTGFGFFPFFLPVFLAAFVEQDEKSMNKATGFQQKAVLSAGTFANLLTAILFFIIMILFFSFSFSASGVVFDNYAYNVVPIAGITMINGINVSSPNYNQIAELSKNNSFNEIKINNEKFIGIMGFSKDKKAIALYYDAPAINSGLKGAILEINETKITSLEILENKINSASQGDKINIKTSKGNYEIELGKNPENSEKAWIGIMFENRESKGALGKVIYSVSSFKKPYIYYESKFEAGEFIYNFLWWLVLISFSVALVNMIPAGIFDGGRFFYLTILGLTKNEKRAKQWFKGMTSVLLFFLFVLMAFWIVSFL